MMADSSPESIESLTERSRSMLADLFRHHGLTPGFQDGWIGLGVEPLLVRCTVDRFRENAGTWMIQLTFEVTGAALSPAAIRDTLVGVGETSDAALLEACSTWFHGVLAPIRAAFSSGADSAEIHIYDLSVVNMERGEQTAWEAFAGQLQLRGADAGQNDLGRNLADAPPLVTTLLDSLTGLLADSTDSLSWIKLFVNRQPGGGLTVECKFNNEDWPAGMAALSKARWPGLSEGMLFKQFALFKRGKSEAVSIPASAPEGKRGGCLGVMSLAALALGLTIKALMK